jgi:hypothetical protein
MMNMNGRRVRKAATQQDLLLWPVEAHAQLKELGSCWLPVKLVGLSVAKAHLDAGFRSVVGRRADLRIDGFVLMRGTIVEAQDWQIYITFDAPLHPYVFHHILSASRADLDQTELLAFTSSGYRPVTRRR